MAEVDKCQQCGQPLHKLALGSICRPCILDRARVILLDREREAWELARPKDIALSRARVKESWEPAQLEDAGRLRAQGSLVHLVLGVDSDRTYCGKGASQQKWRRSRMKLDDLPRDLCTDCKAALEQLMEIQGRVKAWT